MSNRLAAAENGTRKRGHARIEPRADVYERAGGFVVTLDVPGVDRESLRVEVENGRLDIEGRTYEPAREGFELVHREYGAREYARSFTLPDFVDPDRIEAELENGVLRLHLPGTPAARPRQVHVKTKD